MSSLLSFGSPQLLLFVALAALLRGCFAASANTFCVQTAKIDFNKVSDLEKKALKTTACAADGTDCTECYTLPSKTGTNVIKEYKAECGDKSKTDADFHCNKIAKCATAAATECRVVLDKLIKPATNDLANVVSCKHAILYYGATTEKNITEDTKEFQICPKGTNQGCGSGVGYIDGKLDIEYMGCKAECDKTVGDKRKDKENKVVASCTACDGDKCTMSTSVKPTTAPKNEDTKPPAAGAKTTPKSASIPYGNLAGTSLATVIALMVGSMW